MTKPNFLLAGAIIGFTATYVVAQEKQTSRSPTAAKILKSAELQWRDAGPSLPAGAQVVVLDGDPRQEGSFTMRLKMPAGYRIAPHTHPTAERVTVISGVVRLGMGDKFDESGGREMKTGDFATVPPGVAHFAWSAGEAILQIQSEGPFERKFVEPPAAASDVQN